MITALALTAALMSYDIHKDAVDNHQYIAVVDFTLPDTDTRFEIYDVINKKTVFDTYVAHGVGSGTGAYAESFGNVPGSFKSSLGALRTGHEYQGKHGLSMTLEGLDSTDNNISVRSIMLHGADYVGPNMDVGHSLGCLAVPSDEIGYVISKLGSHAFIYDYGKQQ